MTAPLSLLAIVIVAYVAAHALFDWIARRYRVVSGAEYLILGILLGPHISGVLSESVVQSFAPFMILALGWTGAALGMNCHLPRLIRTPGALYTTALTEAALTFVFVSGLLLFAMAWVFDVSYFAAIAPAVSLGAIATATTTLPTTVLDDGTPSTVLAQLQTAALIDSVFAICAFGIVLCVVHVDVRAGGRVVTATEWAAITIGIGVICGILFHLFIGTERHRDLLFTAMAGAIILASGAAVYLRLSPLPPAFLIGAILVNTSTNRREIAAMMEAVEKPLYYVLLLFAGAAWSPSSRLNWILPVVLFVFVRAAGKLGSARIATRLHGDRELLNSNWGRGLLGQGTIALAIGMSYYINDTSFLPSVVFTASIASVLAADLFSVRRVSALLRDSEPASLPHFMRRFSKLGE